MPDHSRVSPPEVRAADRDSITPRIGRVLNHIAEKGLYAILLWVPLAFFPEVFWPFDITRVTVLRVLTIIVLAAFLGRIACSRECRLIRLPMLVVCPIVIYAVCYALSAIFSISPTLSLYGMEGKSFGLVSMVNMLVLFSLVVNVLRRREQYVRCLNMLVLSSSVVALLGLYEYFGQIDERHFQAILILSLLMTGGALCAALLRMRAGASHLTYGWVVLGALLVVSVLLFLDALAGSEVLYVKIDDAGSFIGAAGVDSGFSAFGKMVAGQVDSTFGHPEFLMSFLVLSVAIALGFVWNRQWLYSAPLLLIALCLVLSVPHRELGGYGVVFLGVSCILVVLAAARFVARKYLIGLALVLVVLPAVCVFSTNLYDSRDKVSDFATTHIGGPDSDRGRLISIAWDTVQDHPVLGSGPNTFADTFTQYKPLDFAREQPDRREDKVHNAFVEALATTGWLGTISYTVMLLALFGYLTRWVVKNRGRPATPFVMAVLLAGMAYTLQSWVMFHSTIPYTFFWVLMGIGLGLTTIDHRMELAVNWNASGAVRCIGVVIIVCVAGLVAWVAVRPLGANHYYYRALSTSTEGDLSEVGSLLDKAVSWDGSQMVYRRDYARVLLAGASGASDHGDMTMFCRVALAAVDRLVDQEPQQTSWHHERAWVKYKCQNVFGDAGVSDALDEVVADLQEAIRLYPHGYLSQLFLAHVETERGNLEAAIAADELALLVIPGGPDEFERLGRNHLTFGDQLRETGRMDEARAHFERAVEVTGRLVASVPDDANAHYLLGLAHESAGSPEAALAEYEIAIELDPAFSMAWEALERLKG